MAVVKMTLTRFEEAAVGHSEATEAGDYKKGNKCYTAITKSVALLKEQNAIQQLQVLLNHNSAGVRVWAATYLLPVLENEALLVLEQIAEAGIRIHSFNAKMTLSEWRKGNLTL